MKRNITKSKSKEVVIRISGSLKRLQECRTIDVLKVKKVLKI